jgi:hypothetical protein
LLLVHAYVDLVHVLPDGMSCRYLQAIVAVLNLVLTCTVVFWCSSAVLPDLLYIIIYIYSIL